MRLRNEYLICFYVIFPMILSGCVRPLERSSYSSEPPSSKTLDSAYVSNLPAKEQERRLGIYKKAIADQMRDPSSVEFRDIHLYQNMNGNDIVCGELNAKNGYGGYIGFEDFYAAAFMNKNQTEGSVVLGLRSTAGNYVDDRCRLSRAKSP